MAEQILKTAEQKALQLAGRQRRSISPWPGSTASFGRTPNKPSTGPTRPIRLSRIRRWRPVCLPVPSPTITSPDSAKPLIDNYPQTQFADFAQAKLHLAAGQKQSAVESLRAAIDKDPGSIVAEQAQLLLTEQQAEYIPIFDTGLILATLKQTVGEQIVPQFVSPDQMLSFQLNVRGNRFSTATTSTASSPSQTTGMNRSLSPKTGFAGAE